MFKRCVYDPSYYLHNTYSKDNYCIPASVVLSLHIRTQSKTQRWLQSKQGSLDTENVLKSLNTNGCYSMSRKGMKLSSIGSFEKQNSPISSTLINRFPSLVTVKGISVNIFRIREENNNYYLTPLAISKHSRSTDYLQCDLISITEDILAPGQKIPDNHCLFVPFLATLMSRFTHAANRGHYNKICRSCLAIFQTDERLKSHYETCSIDARHSVARRRTKNILIHRPYQLNRWSGRMEVNAMTWKRAWNYTLLRPLCILFSDLEAYNVNLPDNSSNLFQKIPNNSISAQQIMSYQYVFKSMYPSIALPPELALPRVKFCPHKPGATERDLFISYFLSLRDDLQKHANFLQSILRKDVPPPPQSQRSVHELAQMLASTNCEICGKKFGSTSYSKRSKKSYVVKKAWDHHHYMNSVNFPVKNDTKYGTLKAVLCQVGHAFFFTFFMTFFQIFWLFFTFLCYLFLGLQFEQKLRGVVFSCPPTCFFSQCTGTFLTNNTILQTELPSDGVDRDTVGESGHLLKMSLLALGSFFKEVSRCTSTVLIHPRLTVFHFHFIFFHFIPEL